MSEKVELYVLVNTTFAGEIVGFPKGGGSSTLPRIKAYDSLASAKRGQRQNGGKIAKITQMEVIG